MSRDVWSREVFTTTVSEQPKDHLGLNSKAEEEEVKVKVFTFLENRSKKTLFGVVSADPRLCEGQVS